MRTLPLKLKDVRQEIKLDVKLCVRGAYIKVTEWSLTTSGTTGKVHLETWRLVSLVVMQTVSVNPNVHNLLLKL